jgi:hypothetical protein
MENIIEPNESFDFSKLTLTHPSGIQGGACFTKIEYNKKPLFIQTVKSNTRQGFVKTGKKYYCDLMFDKNSESLLNWFEKLEETCQKLIYEKKDSWFKNNIEENDIETAFNSIIRVYKSGKFYLVRVNVKNNENNTFSIKIYDEYHSTLSIEDVTQESNIISIIEIQGIKFTSRNFQIEIELKQVMVLNNNAIFENCLIKTTKNDTHLEKHLENVNIIEKQPEINQKEENENIIDLDIEELETEDDNKELKEVNLNINFENNLETFTLKKPNQVYFELYREARNKAKLAKKQAIIAYLEAKNIKKTYMIDNLNDSESEFDAEIDEVSESELEGL